MRKGLILFSLLSFWAIASPVQAPVKQVRDELCASVEALHVKCPPTNRAREIKFQALCGKLLAKYESRLASLDRGPLRQALLVATLQLSLMCEVETVDLISVLRREVPPDSPAWAVDPSLMIPFAEEAFADDASTQAWLDTACEHNADPKVRLHLLNEAFYTQLVYEQDRVIQDLFARMHKEWPQDPLTLAAKHALDSFLKRAAGQPCPDFRCQSLDAPDTVFTLGSFRGKTLLIHLYCSHTSSKEFAYLQHLWSLYRHEAFEILTLVEEPLRRKSRTPPSKPILSLPWKTGKAPADLQHPIYNLASTPVVALVGPDGRIFTTRSQALSFDALGDTLRRCLEQAKPKP